MGLAYIVCVSSGWKSCYRSFFYDQSRFLRGRQGDQIGRIFDFRVIIYFGQFFKLQK
jgi:hypothetical protein